jgi:hypothetical protein
MRRYDQTIIWTAVCQSPHLTAVLRHGRFPIAEWGSKDTGVPCLAMPRLHSTATNHILPAKEESSMDASTMPQTTTHSRYMKDHSSFGPHLALAAILLLAAGANCQDYFPPNTFSDFEVKWFASDLKALQEPSIWQQSQSSDSAVYRFLWLRTFHHPISIRLSVHADGTGTLVTKVTSGAGGYAPGKLIENQTLELSKDHVQWFVDAIQTQKYWDLKSGHEPGGCDGAEWILEGAKNHQYRVVERWSPNGGPIRTLGTMMVFEMARLKIPQQEIY